MNNPIKIGKGYALKDSSQKKKYKCEISLRIKEK